MQILYTAFESAPFIKTGGLGDVAEALPAAVKSIKGDDVRVMLPKLKSIPKEYTDKMQFITSFDVPLSWRREYCGIFSLDYKGVTYYFLDNERYFFRDKPYGEFDDAERMAFFSKAVLESTLYLDDFAPDILHANDWHTALTCVYIKEQYKETKLSKTKTVFTIHNLKFQGVFGAEIMGDVIGLPWTDETAKLLCNGEYGPAINLLKGAIIYADRVTTVSPSYAEEICLDYYGEGLSDVLSGCRDKLSGILNGINNDLWNPAKDEYIDVKFTARGISKKAKNKLALQKELGLSEDADIPMFAVISRLTEQKGLDLLTYILPHIEESRMQLVVLGVGDYKYEEAFSWYANYMPEKFAALIKFDNVLSHRLYAAADCILIPSRFEPCGLTQMIAMRYGTLPLVRETGGLKDTVNNENGFSFKTFNAGDMQYTLDCALDIWFNNKDEWKRKMKNAMAEDFSFVHSAEKHLELYNGML